MKMRPIRTKKDHKVALARLEAIWPDGQKFERQELADEFEVLSILIDAYESRTVPIAPPSPIDAIKFEMEARGLNNTQLADLMGVSVARVGEVLSGKRGLSIAMIRNLVANLNMDARVLIGATDRRVNRTADLAGTRPAIVREFSESAAERHLESK